MVILSCSALQRWEGNFRASLWVYPELRLSLVLDSRLFWFKPQDISRLHFSEKTLASKCFSLSAFASPTTSFESAPRSTPPSWMQSRMSQKKPGKLLQSLDLLWFMMIYACIHMFSYVFMLQADAKSLKILGLGGLLAQNFKDLEKWYEASVPTSSCMSMHVDVCWCVQKKHTKFGAHKRLGVRSAGMHLSCLKLKAKMFF